MATFEYEPWVTGEVITAEKLNSRGKPIVHLTEEDISNGWSINIGANLPKTFFIDMSLAVDDGNDGYIFRANVISELGRESGELGENTQTTDYGIEFGCKFKDSPSVSYDVCYEISTGRLYYEVQEAGK